MAWSTESPVSTQYSVDEDAATLWDSGTTLWDLVEHVAGTYWDIDPVTDDWSKESGL